MHEKLKAIEAEHNRLTERMSSQEVASDPKAYRDCAIAARELEEVVSVFRAWQAAQQAIDEANEIIRTEKDPEVVALARQEKEDVGGKPEELEQELKLLLLPKDPNDKKNVIVEIRAGTGGDEAGLFCADLYRMYTRYAELRGWGAEQLSANATGMDGLKAVSFKLAGDGVYSQLKFEGGVHRVQRVPATESQGRIHTSTCTVAVLPEAEEVELEIDENELKIDVYRSTGPGGQSVNTTDSAVRINHVPTGMVVTCQDEKSQHKNKAKALQVLRARLLDQKRREEADKLSADRKSQVGTGERSEKIRTYNYPQSRITDHRIGKSVHNLDGFMNGEIQEMVDALIAADRAARMEASIAESQAAG